MNKDKKEEKYSMQTHLIHGKHITNKWDYEHHVTAPISSSTTFRLDSVERGAEGFIHFANTSKFGDEAPPIFIYDRLGEPNKDMLEENIAYVEKGESAVSFTSGMGAISAILGILTKSGDEIITHQTLYGCTISLLNNWYPRYNIKSTPIDLTNLENLKEKLNNNVRVIYFETPANPNLDIIDINAVKSIINEYKAINNSDEIYIVVDNTFATSFCQRPLEHGADFVVHSLTKGMGGFGTEMGGVVVTPQKFRDSLLLYRKDFGAVLNTRSAWAILTYGLPSLPLRVSQQIKSAMMISEFLENHPKIKYVNYPGLKSFKYHELAKKQMIDFDGNFAPGSLLYFGLMGDSPEDSRTKGAKLMDYAAVNAYTITLAVSLGHTRTLIEHPASMTHSVVPPEKLEERGIDPGGVRIAVGLENSLDIIKDLENCLEII